ncbi:MAG: hypothetical protein JRN20_19295, partial [Nitrososphaerota archaeon]|nr:hypothetical protein [Nitrososphaerota archaeon]
AIAAGVHKQPYASTAAVTWQPGNIAIVPTYPVTFQVCGTEGLAGQACDPTYPAIPSIGACVGVGQDGCARGEYIFQSTSFPTTIYLPRTSPNSGQDGSASSISIFVSVPMGYAYVNSTFGPNTNVIGYGNTATWYVMHLTGPTTVTMNVYKIVTPDAWWQSPYFNVDYSSVSMKDVVAPLLGVLTGVIGGASELAFGSNSPAIETWGITPANGASPQLYYGSLQYYFNISAPAGETVGANVTMLRI